MNRIKGTEGISAHGFLLRELGHQLALMEAAMKLDEHTLAQIAESQKTLTERLRMRRQAIHDLRLKVKRLQESKPMQGDITILEHLNSSN